MNGARPPSFDTRRCKLTVASDLRFLPLIQAFVHEYASEVGFPQAELGRIDLLMEEAATNVIQGAFAADERATFDITCERAPAGIQITVHDEGLPYDPSQTPEFDPAASLEYQTGAGLGSFLMRQIADTVEFHNLGSHGKETVFIKYVESESVAESGPPEPAGATSESEPMPEALRTELDLMPMLPEQAIEVCRCIYDAYRYTYVNEHVYYPDRILALNQSGDMFSAVATTSEGEVAGHAALVFEEGSREVADLAIVATKARFRGQSVARRLGEYLAGEALERDLSGLYIEQVTVHVYTQRFCHRLGFRDCGFLLAYSPATMSFKGIAEETGGRHSVILGFKYLRPRESVRLHAPERHRKVIAGIFETLGAPVEFAGRDEAAEAAWTADDESVLHVSFNTNRLVATVRIPEYGRDLVRRLREELYRLRRGDVKVVDVLLNLRQPGTGEVCALLEDLGFLFTGILPGGAHVDWLVLQYFNGVVVDYDAIEVDDAATRDLLAYIRANDPNAE